MNIIVSIVVTIIFLCFQIKFFLETRRLCSIYKNFFARHEDYVTGDKSNNGVVQLKNVGYKGSYLSQLINEINHYVIKTKGTTDFNVIQNKVERKLNMLYEQTTARLSFPTYLGLMGTFVGVFMGVLFFLRGFDHVEGITDEAVTGLLQGVLVSMFTSLIGLGLTTFNNASVSDAKKQIEEDKNEFYDFVQTELMPSLDVSMVAALSRLHTTVDKFEPAFNAVIHRFQATFDSCTASFGSQFEQNVKTVSGAVDLMGRNMDKINDNIRMQERLISALKSDDIVRGMDKYMQAANHFVRITQSLDKFEEARRMMLAATQEAINIQKQYADSLKTPREIAVRIHHILDRIKDFEKNLNELGPKLNSRDIIGRDVADKIEKQINAIAKHKKIADQYLGIADSKLEDLFMKQTDVITKMNENYEKAIRQHADGFENVLKEQTAELQKRHQEFIDLLHRTITVEEVHKDFSNLRRLNDILEQLQSLNKGPVKSDDLRRQLQTIHDELTRISKSVEGRSGSVFGGLFGGSNKSNK